MAPTLCFSASAVNLVCKALITYKQLACQTSEIVIVNKNILISRLVFTATSLNINTVLQTKFKAEPQVVGGFFRFRIFGYKISILISIGKVIIPKETCRI